MEKNQDAATLFSVKQVADMLGLSRRTLWTMIQSEVIGHVRVSERRVMITRADFDAYVFARRVPARV